MVLVTLGPWTSHMWSTPRTSQWLEVAALPPANTDVEHPLEELVLGGAQRDHGDLDLPENSKKEQQKISPSYGVQCVQGVYKDFLSWETSKREENRVVKVPEVGTTHLGVPGGQARSGILCPPRVPS